MVIFETIHINLHLIGGGTKLGPPSKRRETWGPRKIDGTLIKTLRRRLGMTQRQLADMMGVDQGTVSRWEREVESPRPARRAALGRLLIRDESRRAMLRSVAFVRQDYRPSTLLDSQLRLVEISESGKRHFRDRGLDPDAMIGINLQSYAARLENPSIHDQLAKTLAESGLLAGEALFFRFVRNHKGSGHATVYEPIFEDGELLGILNYVTAYFELPKTDEDTFELVEAVTIDDPTSAQVLLRGRHAETAWAALRRR